MTMSVPPSQSKRFQQALTKNKIPYRLTRTFCPRQAALKIADRYLEKAFPIWIKFAGGVR